MKETFLKGIIKENPIFVLLLGMCPTLAVTTTFENALVMGLSVTFVLFFTNIIVSLIKKIVPEQVRIPVYVLIIATFVTIIELLLKAYTPGIYSTLGIYIPLIVVNCIVLGRALGFASKEPVIKSMLDGIGFGLGFLLALITLATFREVLGTNTITIMDNLSTLTGYKMVYQILPNTNFLPISIFSKPAGAFISLGLLIGIFNVIKEGRSDKV
ncbi:MAG: electron transport complex subunit E [Bacilli bacterium]|nr:electron transport complex subunit E [Bacilli bacterium]